MRNNCDSKLREYFLRCCLWGDVFGRLALSLSSYVTDNGILRCAYMGMLMATQTCWDAVNEIYCVVAIKLVYT